MLVVHEVSRVKGASATAFVAATQKLWQEQEAYGAVAGWFFEVSHGTGPSYRVWSGLRLPDWTVWETITREMAYGNLAPAVEQLDRCRYDSDSCLLQLVSEVDSSGFYETGAGETVWVGEISADGDDTEPASFGGPHLVMDTVLGRDAGTRTVLHRERAADVLDSLLDRSPPAGRTGGRTQTWILRPVPWSPLQ